MVIDVVCSYLTGVNSTSPTLWLVMEYITGFALNEIIDESRKAKRYLMQADHVALVAREVSFCLCHATSLTVAPVGCEGAKLLTHSTQSNYSQRCKGGQFCLRQLLTLGFQDQI